MPNSSSLLPKNPRIATDQAGSGPAIILTHGFGDSATTWDPLQPTLEARFTTVRWDLPGHGRSAKPTGKQHYTLERVLDDFEYVIEATPGDAVLIGHSLGGYLSQYRAVGNLDRIRGLVLIATGPGFRSITPRAFIQNR